MHIIKVMLLTLCLASITGCQAQTQSSTKPQVCSEKANKCD